MIDTSALLLERLRRQLFLAIRYDRWGAKSGASWLCSTGLSSSHTADESSFWVISEGKCLDCSFEVWSLSVEGSFSCEDFSRNLDLFWYEEWYQDSWTVTSRETIIFSAAVSRSLYRLLWEDKRSLELPKNVGPFSWDPSLAPRPKILRQTFTRRRILETSHFRVDKA